MEKRFRFRNFPVYRDARRFAKEMKDVARDSFPSNERFGLTSQFCRALDSVVLNIAEGSDRSTDKDFALFLNRSHTSINEVVACLDVALDEKYIALEVHEKMLNKASDLVDQLTDFRKSLLNSPTK